MPAPEGDPGRVAVRGDAGRRARQPDRCGRASGDGDSVDEALRLRTQTVSASAAMPVGLVMGTAGRRARSPRRPGPRCSARRSAVGPAAARSRRTCARGSRTSSAAPAHAPRTPPARGRSDTCSAAPGAGHETSRGCHWTAYTCHSPGTPLNRWTPRSLNVTSAPAVTSRTVLVTRILPGRPGEGARGDVDGDAADLVAHDLGLARVDAGPDGGRSRAGRR